MVGKTYTISGMTCGSCAMRIEKTLRELIGVRSAYVNFAKRELQIEADDSVTLPRLNQVVAVLGKYTFKEAGVPSQPNQTSAWVWAAGGAILIFVLFYLVQALGMQSWSAPLQFMQDRWYLVLPLIVGFAAQAGLFRAIHLHTRHGGGIVTATSGGVSSGTMLACCMHNLVLLFPVLGVSGLAAFFAAYQTQVFLVSIFVAYLGVGFMLWKYRTLQKACATHHALVSDISN